MTDPAREQARDYARRMVVPNYGVDDMPTPYESGMVRMLEAAFLAGAEQARADGAAEARREVEHLRTLLRGCEWTDPERTEEPR
jgi:hypothetical protein